MCSPVYLDPLTGRTLGLRAIRPRLDFVALWGSCLAAGRPASRSWLGYPAELLNFLFSQRSRGDNSQNRKCFLVIPHMVSACGVFVTFGNLPATLALTRLSAGTVAGWRARAKDVRPLCYSTWQSATATLAICPAPPFYHLCRSHLPRPPLPLRAGTVAPRGAPSCTLHTLSRSFTTSFHAE